MAKKKLIFLSMSLTSAIIASTVAVSCGEGQKPNKPSDNQPGNQSDNQDDNQGDTTEAKVVNGISTLGKVALTLDETVTKHKVDSEFKLDRSIVKFKMVPSTITKEDLATHGETLQVFFDRNHKTLVGKSTGKPWDGTKLLQIEGLESEQFVNADEPLYLNKAKKYYSASAFLTVTLEGTKATVKFRLYDFNNKKLSENVYSYSFDLSEKTTSDPETPVVKTLDEVVAATKVELSKTYNKKASEVTTADVVISNVEEGYTAVMDATLVSSDDTTGKVTVKVDFAKTGTEEKQSKNFDLTIKASETPEPETPVVKTLDDVINSVSVSLNSEYKGKASLVKPENIKIEGLPAEGYTATIAPNLVSSDDTNGNFTISITFKNTETNEEKAKEYSLVALVPEEEYIDKTVTIEAAKEFFELNSALSVEDQQDLHTKLFGVTPKWVQKDTTLKEFLVNGKLLFKYKEKNKEANQAHILSTLSSSGTMHQNKVMVSVNKDDQVIVTFVPVKEGAYSKVTNVAAFEAALVTLNLGKIAKPAPLPEMASNAFDKLAVANKALVVNKNDPNYATDIATIKAYKFSATNDAGYIYFKGTGATKITIHFGTKSKDAKSKPAMTWLTIHPEYAALLDSEAGGKYAYSKKVGFMLPGYPLKGSQYALKFVKLDNGEVGIAFQTQKSTKTEAPVVHVVNLENPTAPVEEASSN